MKEDDSDAIAQLKRGDIRGLELLVRTYQVRAVRAAYLVTRSTAEDVVQAAFLRVYERAHQFDARRPFVPWFLRIVVNDAMKAVTRRDRDVSLEHRQEGEELSLADLLPNPSPGPEELAERAGVRQAVWEALGKLSPEQRSAVVLRYYLGLHEREIGERIGRPLGTVKWLLHGARGRLRALLGPASSGKSKHIEKRGEASDERVQR